MIIPWLIVWAICNTPDINAGWNWWFVSLIVAIVAL